MLLYIMVQITLKKFALYISEMRNLKASANYKKVNYISQILDVF